MNKNLKKAVASAAALTMVFAVPTGVYAADGENEKITFCLDWTPNTNHTGLYVALAKGYYEDAGLDVEIVQPPENGAALMCAAGQAQFAIEAQDTMAASLALDEPLGITAVAAVIQHNTSGILSRAGDGIDTPAGLTGKTYSTWDSPIELAMLENVVNSDGGDFDQVTLIPNDITDEPAALAAHQTDAIWVFQGWGGVNAEVGSLKDAEELVKKSQEFLSAKYIDDADSWGVIDPERWNAFYKWLYENQLCEKDLTDVGFSNDYLPQ